MGRLSSQSIQPCLTQICGLFIRHLRNWLCSLQLLIVHGQLFRALALQIAGGRNANLGRCCACMQECRSAMFSFLQGIWAVWPRNDVLPHLLDTALPTHPKGIPADAEKSHIWNSSWPIGTGFGCCKALSSTQAKLPEAPAPLLAPLPGTAGELSAQPTLRAKMFRWVHQKTPKFALCCIPSRLCPKVPALALQYEDREKSRSQNRLGE